MSYKPRYEKGDWKASCDACGRLFKASSLSRRWDGLMVCSSDWETRQPQDFVRGVADTQAPYWTRSETSDSFVFIPTNEAIAGIAITGLARAGFGWSIGIVPPSSFTEP